MKTQSPLSINIDPYSEAIEISERVKRKIAAKVIGILVPVMTGGVVISSLLYYGCHSGSTIPACPRFYFLFSPDRHLVFCKKRTHNHSFQPFHRFSLHEHHFWHVLQRRCFSTNICLYHHLCRPSFMVLQS